MFFLKGSVELSTDFYRAAGECLICGQECLSKKQDILRSSFMPLFKADELLDLVIHGFLKLTGLLDRLPVQNASSAKIHSLIHEDLLFCRRLKQNLVLMYDLNSGDPGHPLAVQSDFLGNARLQRLVVNTEILYQLKLDQLTRLTVKLAKVRLSKFSLDAIAAVTAKPLDRALSPELSRRVSAAFDSTLEALNNAEDLERENAEITLGHY
jgi:hypothetical protein